MLINDLKYFKHSSNYNNTYSGIDTPEKSPSGLKNFYEYPIQDFDYQFNSWGFRGPEYDQYIGKAVNICLGDSFTVNVGGPVEYSWCSQLAKHFDIPTVNLGMDGAGNNVIKLVYNRACEVFDVQNTFVMYSYLHRRIVDNKFVPHANTTDTENFKYFVEQRIPNVIECALPGWCWTEEEKQFLSELGIYFLDVLGVLNFSNHQTIDRRLIVEESYNTLRGPDWPTFKEFVNGDDPHPDMFTENFGKFVSNKTYMNRDGHHMDFKANEIYTNYLSNQWSKNES